jgi:hypothetical protein
MLNTSLSTPFVVLNSQTHEYADEMLSSLTNPLTMMTEDEEV